MYKNPVAGLYKGVSIKTGGLDNNNITA